MIVTCDSGKLADIMSKNDFEHLPLTELRRLASNWRFPGGTVYLNHGSFGATPTEVRLAKRRWQDRLDDQPMNFFVREFEPAFHTARETLSTLVGTSQENLVFVENATAAMNIVAHNLHLEKDDEILLTDHEYGAVRRIWDRKTRREGARVVEAELPWPVHDTSEIIKAIFSRVTSKTRMLVVSHITSATALILPIHQICQQAKSLDILVCVDGPHAIAQEELSLNDLPCDFYTASCHKWLCGPLGTGFLYVHPEHQSSISPVMQSWGRLLPAIPKRWDEEFYWSGTRDPSGYLAIPAAIDFMNLIGLNKFRMISHQLAQVVRHRLESLTGETAWVPDDREYYGCMTEVPLPEGDWSELQNWLWQQHGIEVPIIHFKGHWFIRVSCHLHTLPEHFEQLFAALAEAFERSPDFESSP